MFDCVIKGTTLDHGLRLTLWLGSAHKPFFSSVRGTSGLVFIWSNQQTSKTSCTRSLRLNPVVYAVLVHGLLDNGIPKSDRMRAEAVFHSATVAFFSGAGFDVLSWRAQRKGTIIEGQRATSSAHAGTAGAKEEREGKAEHSGTRREHDGAG